jgi:hypothetical protein
MQYSLTKSCPEGKGMDEGDIVTAILLAEEKTGDLKILGKLYQPWPHVLRRQEPSGAEGRFTFPSLCILAEVYRMS